MDVRYMCFQNDSVLSCASDEQTTAVAEEAEKVQFSWNFIGKVFLAALVISLMLSLISYLVAALVFPLIGEDQRRNLVERLNSVAR